MNEPNQEARITALKSKLAASADGVLEALATEHGVSLLTAIECLPPELWRSAPGSAFVEAMQDIAEWGDVTVIVHTLDVILEFCGPMPKGRTGRGFYNLQGKTGLTGHLRHDRCEHIVFVRRPFMKMATASVQFFNAAGECMFKVYVGRDETKALREDQLLRFEALASRLGASPAATVHS